MGRAGHGPSPRRSIGDALRSLPRRPEGTGFGADIDAAHEVLLAPGASPADKHTALMRWLGRSQPCLFGRLAARADQGPAVCKGLDFEICWIDDADLDRGAEHIGATVRAARTRWKHRAVSGATSSFLIVFNSERIAYARPGPQLADLCLTLADCYLTEHAPTAFDTVYTESVPLRMPDGSLALFKASTQLFYTGAHLRRNHDRRFPGGLLISMNSPGHYAHSLVSRGLAADLESAMAFVRQNATRTIGNGGIGHPERLSSSWLNSPAGGPGGGGGSCRSPDRPGAAETDPVTFSAVYQVDVLVQKDVVTDDGERRHRHLDGEVWPSLRLDYITARGFPPDHPDFGWSNGVPITESGLLGNPWEPIVAANTPDFDY